MALVDCTLHFSLCAQSVCFVKGVWTTCWMRSRSTEKPTWWWLPTTRTRWNTRWGGSLPLLTGPPLIKQTWDQFRYTTMHKINPIYSVSNRMNELGLSAADNKVSFGQLLGMCDQISFPLGEKRNTQADCSVSAEAPMFSPFHKTDSYF